MNKIKKMMFINIIITIFIVITGFTSIVYAADITLTKENDDIWAPFFEATGNVWTYCRNHAKHTTKYAPITYELSSTKNMTSSTRNFLEKNENNHKLVQSAVWYLNSSRKQKLEGKYNTLAEENSKYTAKYYSEEKIKDILNRYAKNDESTRYEVSVSDAYVRPENFHYKILEKKDDGSIDYVRVNNTIREKDFYAIKVYKSIEGYTDSDNLKIEVFPSKNGKQVEGESAYTLYKPYYENEVCKGALRCGKERKIDDEDKTITIMINKETVDLDTSDGFYIKISAKSKKESEKGILKFYSPTKVTINGSTQQAGKYLKDAQKLLRFDFKDTTTVGSDHTIAEIADDSEESVKYIKSIKDENGNVVASVGNGKLKQPEMNYTAGNRLETARISYNGRINTTVMDGYTITYGIRYYSTGTGERTLAENFDDTYSPGLEYEGIQNAKVTLNQDGSPKTYTDGDGNKTITVEAPENITLQGYGATSKKNGTGIDKGFEYYDVFLTFKVNLSKAKNSDTIKQFKNNDVAVNRGYEITGKVFTDENLITDGKITKSRDNLLGQEDKLVSGIKVELIDDQGMTVQPIKDSTTGISYPTTVYTDNNGVYKFTHLPVDGEYYVKFTYNGQEYENVKYEKVQGSKNSSYAEEKNDTSSNDSRVTFNEKFTRIDESNSEKYSLKNTSKEESPQKQPQVTGATNKSNVSQEEFAISSYSRKISLTTSYKEYLNLGIFKRHFDLSLENKLESMEIAINGVTQKIESTNGGIISGTILNEDLYFKEVDYKNKNEDTSKELAVYLNYKLTISNNSLEQFTGEINSINFWYDSRLIPAPADNQSDEIRIGGDVDGGDSKFKTCEIKLAGKKVEPNESITVNLKLKLTRDIIEEYINNPNETLKIFETVAEISSYGSKYSSDNVFGNGHSGNAGKIDEDSNAGNVDIQKYVSEIRKSTDANTVLNFFDEDDARRSLGIKLQVDDIPRKLSGRVFEDKTTHNNQTNERLGDGIYNSGDKNIQGVKVELLEITGRNSVGNNTYNKAKVYDKTTKMFKDAEVISDENGQYVVEGYIPSANYVIRFTYGDGSTGIYNAQDYKSTIDKTNESYKAANTTEQLPNGEDNYWYTHENIKNKSVAKDDDANMTKRALDYNRASELENNTNLDVRKYELENTATTAKFCAPIKWAGNTSATKDEQYGVGIQNMNLGLAERPRSELKINKTIDHITLTTSDGRTLIDGNQDTIKSTSWTTRYVQAIVDENLIYGSTLKITYKYEVENIGEVDYLSNGRVAYNRDGTIVANNTNRRYYDYGDLQGQQAKTKTYVEKIIDYVDNQLMYDENMQSNPENAEKTNKDDWHVATEEELNMLGEDAKEGAKDINTKLITENLNKELEPGEKTDPIYLTLSKVLSSGEDKDKNELVYNNYVEIIKSWNTAGRRSYSITGNKLLSDVTNEKRGAPIINEDDVKKKAEYILSIPGDLNPKTLITLDYEPDSDKAQEVQIVPPFGSQRVIWTIIATISAIILAGGIYLINRKVLKAKNKK